MLTHKVSQRFTSHLPIASNASLRPFLVAMAMSESSATMLWTGEFCTVRVSAATRSLKVPEVRTVLSHAASDFFDDSCSAQRQRINHKVGVVSVVTGRIQEWIFDEKILTCFVQLRFIFKQFRRKRFELGLQWRRGCFEFSGIVRELQRKCGFR